MIRFEDILETVESYKPDFDEELLQRAYVFSAFAHKGQIRRSGEPYLIHPLNVAQILAEMKLDETSISVGLLHDVLEDTLTTKEKLASLFGEDVAELVDGVTKISRYAYVSKEEQQAETFRKMLLAMISDLRVILVKLADRLHNMRTLEHLPEPRRRAIAGETMEIYAPIANRLGMGAIKSELEDLAFRHIEPKRYREIEKAVEEKAEISRGVAEQIRTSILEKLDEIGLAAEVVGRVKSILSIHHKLVRQGIEIGQLYDYLAFRIITSSVPDCYGALGIVHQRWRPVPGRIKDYIAMPKPNFYQSLHTTVVGDNGNPFEIQIRTREMDLIAEQGVAAHWKYKEGRIDSSSEDDESFLWLRQLVEWQKDIKDPKVFLNSLKVDLYPDEVYTFTPKGDVFAFPRGATPLDFAYRIHTDVGHQCIGARVNGKLVPLKTSLHNGDIVEILTGPHQKPSRAWLSLVVTSRARHKIRHWLNTEQKSRSIELGRKLLEKEARRFRLSVKKLAADGAFDPILRESGFGRFDDLLADVGYGKTSPRDVLEKAAPEGAREPSEEAEGKLQQAVRRILPFGSRGIKVKGQDDFMSYLAKCCNPLPGEEIIGYVTRGKGVAVHTSDCPNVKNLMFNPDRQIEVSWGEQSEARSLVDLVVDLEDQPGILAKVLSSIAGMKMNLRQVEARSSEGRGKIDLTVEISDVKQLDRVTKAIGDVEGVSSVRRKYNIRQAAG
ncbi:MAG: bifunctional (p)ppGpp synthetase/guanosine-3',5'-bis(diphosphate) 3'-pyrophosphohydrolase [Thermoanaerobaculia bacterium]|nr:bifunctional (p)ppGpp synthetase/guanosine-3',5'-bis(diphosphate) 3'-pyrophosphohydrolase [Thermoanaerobaculia bacterium]